jgi:Arc/MetJ family transcription regulator
MMRTTVEIDPELLAEAMRLCDARTKKQVIAASLTEFVH